MWRRMMMRYAPFLSPLGDKHGEARWARNRFAIDHPSESVKASDHDGVIVDYDCAPFINRILVTGSFGGREISYDRLGPLGNNRADSSEKNCIVPIALADDFWIVGAISSRPPINCHIGVFCWARRGYSGQPQYQCYENKLSNSHHLAPSMPLGSCPLWPKRDMRHVHAMFSVRDMSALPPIADIALLIYTISSSEPGE